MTANGTGTPASRSSAASLPKSEPLAPERRVAVIGMAFRFPGADSRTDYWRTIRDGRQHITRFTPEDFDAADIPSELAAADDFVGASALLEGIDRFDAPFFRMSGQEASLTDPQQRLFLECCHHALEDAGYAGHQPERTGVYASSGYHLLSLKRYLYHNVLSAPSEGGWVSDLHRNVGNYADFAATRAAFRLGLTGPAVGVQTACSSSLVAVHLARQALLSGDTDLALAGATAIHLPQVLGYQHTTGSILSRSGYCRPFDAASDGTVGGNAVAVAVLKRLDRALADEDTVHAVLLGSAVNNDGAAKRHFTEPSVAGQRGAIRSALHSAGVSPDTLGYVEAHGTGTYKGDPMEFRAFTEVFAEFTDRTGYCALGSVKANVGHLDVASGLAGLLKAALVLRHGTIPPLAGLTRPNPLLDLDNSPFYLPEAACRWPDGAGPRRAAVASLGVGGTNAYAILEEPPARSSLPAPAPAWFPPTRPTRPVPNLAPEDAEGAPLGPLPPEPSKTVPHRKTVPPFGAVPLSAQCQEALVDGARQLRTHLALHPAIRHEDLVTTLAQGRRHLRHRLVLYGRNPGELARALDTYLDTRQHGAGTSGVGADRWTTGTVARTRLAPVGWMFSGQGGIRHGAARELYQRYAVIRETLDRCEDTYRAAYGGSLLDGLLAEPEAAGAGAAPDSRPALGSDPQRAGYRPPEQAQAALFALQAAQVQLWFRLTGPPAVVAGHSAGEIAALHAAGALTLEDGLRFAAERGRLMEQHTLPGAMLAVFADAAAVEELLDEVGGLDLAVVNGRRHRVVAGPPAAVAEAARVLSRRHLRCHRLDVTRAFHSRLLDPVLDALTALADRTPRAPTKLPFISAGDGATRPLGWCPDAAYLSEHARQPVHFDRILAEFSARNCGVLHELGPGAVLSGLAAKEDADAMPLPTLQPGAGLRSLWQAAGALYCRGHGLDWQELNGDATGSRIPLPGYAFRRHPYWTGPELVLPVSTGASRETQGHENDVTERTAVEDVEEILGQVVALTAEHLETAPAEIGAEVPFFDLGADSLRMINMLQDVEHQYGVRISMRELFEEADTPLYVARLIAERGSAAEPGAAGASPADVTATAAPDPAGTSSSPATPSPRDAVRPTAPPAAPDSAPAARPATEPPQMPPHAADARTAPGSPSEEPTSPGHNAYASQAALDELAEQVRRLTEHQVHLMQQFTQVLDSHLAAPGQEER